VGSDARVSVAGVTYDVAPDLAGETVVLWWGVFDNELYVEHNEKRFGPFSPSGGPIPLHRYRTHKKTKYERRAERVEKLAGKLELPRSAVLGDGEVKTDKPLEKAVLPFVDPDPFQEFTFSNVIMAKLAIADYLGKPLAKLPVEQINAINGLLEETMNKREIIAWVRQHLRARR
jgi:hypothetical protein